jgi:hypothetical protein
MIACPRHSTLGIDSCFLHLRFAVLAGKGHDAVGLVPILCGQFPVPL